MAKVLVAYGSKMGGTAGIAEAVAEALRAGGHDVTLLPAGRVPRRARFDAAVVGSALYAGRWRGEAVRLLKRLGRAAPKPRVWLFHSGPLGEEHAADAMPLPKKVRAAAEQLEAPEAVTFGGRLDPERAGAIGRAMARNGMGGDWRQLDRAEAWGRALADELGG